MTKEEVISNLSEKKQYSYKEVRHLVTSVSTKRKPVKLKKGDVYRSGAAFKLRPVVVVKVLKDKVVSIPMSTCEDCLNVVAYKSRFFEDGYLSSSFIVDKKEIAESNFEGVFEDRRALNTAIKEIKQIYNKI